MNRKINETLAELLTGIGIAGLLIQLIALLVSVPNTSLRGTILMFAIGLWIGTATAAGLAVHMYRSIDRALDMYTEDAEKYMRKAYLIRTAAILVMAGLVHYLKIGHVMAFFLGVLCLKFGAFQQPLIHMFRKKFRKR